MAKTKDDELQTILQEVQADLDVVLSGERAKLAKASPGEVTSPEVPPDASATASKDSGSPEGSPAGESSPEGTPSGEETAGEKTPGEGSAPEGSPAAEGGAPDGDPAAEGGDSDYVTDPQALQAEYAKLPPEVLKVHYLACKAAMWAVTGGDDGTGAAPDAGTPPAAPAPDAAAGAPAPGLDAAAVPPPAPAPDAGASAGAPPSPPPAVASPSTDQPPPALKSEVGASNAKANGGQITKSQRETELEQQLAKTTQLTQGLAELTRRLIETPRRKAITGLSELTKTEPAVGGKVDHTTLSRKEIMVRLSEKACDESLKKSDRELINRFCVGSIDVSGIAHLLT
jgi:hypothetical protein